MDKFLTDDVENEISITAYRLLTQDLLALYQVMNEGTMNVLGNTDSPSPTLGEC